MMHAGNNAAQDEFGVVPTAPMNDTWIMSETNTQNATWVECVIPCSPPPPARVSQGMDFNQLTGRTVVFGGRGSAGFRGDTWLYNHTAASNRWQQCSSEAQGCLPINTDCMAGPPPCTRNGNRMSYYEDGTRAGMLMFGGSHDGTDVLGDTWLFFGNPGTWQRCVQGSGCPGGDRVEDRCCVGMLYDSARDAIVIFGGQTIPAPDAYRDLWVWTYGSGAAGGWECISPVSTCNVETP